MYRASKGFMRGWFALIGVLVAGTIVAHPAPGGHDVPAGRPAAERTTGGSNAMRVARIEAAAPREASEPVRAVAAPARDEARAGRGEAPTHILDALAHRPAPAPEIDEPPAPDPDDPAEAVASDNLDLDAITARIRDELVPLAIDCHLNFLAGDPAFTGMLVLEFDVLGDESVGGIVDDVRPGEKSTIVDPAFVECLCESMMTVNLDPPADGGQGHASFPLVLEFG
jgi:hypothetical protein